MRRGIIIFLCLMIGAFTMVEAQSRIRTWSHIPIKPDTADARRLNKRHFGQAALTVTGLNLSVWAYDRYVQKADFAKISFHSIGENFKHGFIWDNDRLGTNMFLHPYHGNLYYNAARSNGFNYWQSGLFALGGSAMWELFLENEYPSTNDIIATPIGGMAIGEVLYRASDLIINDRTTGWNRFGREAAVFAISPLREITRIINGEAWKRRSTTGRRFGIPPISFEVSVGPRLLTYKNQIADHGVGISASLNVEYGDRFEPRSTSPYDYFSMRVNLNAEASQPLLGELNIIGRLLSREIVDAPHTIMSVGLYQHYDFYDSDTISSKSAKTPYKLAVPACAGVGVMFMHNPLPRWSFDAHLHFNGILLGGVLTDHYDIKDRNYNLGSGFSIKSGLNINYQVDRFSLSADYDYYRMFTWGYPRDVNPNTANPRTLDAQGDDSVASFGIVRLRADIKVARKLFVTLMANHYRRSTRYRDFPDVKSCTYAFSAMMMYKF